MSTGTGIFLCGLIIGLVMLYGHTKDRWNWENITRNSLIIILVIIFLLYHSMNDWKVFQFELSVKGICVSLMVYFCILFTSYFPMFVLSEIYLNIFSKSFQYNEEGEERLIYKLSTWVTILIIIVLFTFYSDTWREVINEWYDKKFN